MWHSAGRSISAKYPGRDKHPSSWIAVVLDLKVIMGFIKKTLTEVGLGETFSDDEIDEISNISADYMEEIDTIKKELDDANLPDASAYWKEFSKKVKGKTINVANKSVMDAK